MMKTKTALIVIAAVLFTSCFRYATNVREEALIDGVDVDQTLIVSEMELEEGGFGSVLTLWALRDQIINAEQAEIINYQYMAYIDKQESQFNKWHLTWAVSNFYRHGNPDVQEKLIQAYKDATVRAAGMGGIADKHVNSQAIYMGDYHGGGRSYARKHLVVPGNDKYLQSVDEYLAGKKDKDS
jgi:hypothetical protein